MQGVFLPRSRNDENLLKDIYTSIDKLDYYSVNDGKKTMKNDISVLTGDFKKAKEEANVIYNLSL